MQFINELLAGEGYAQIVPAGYMGAFHGYQTVSYGDSKLQTKSWIALKTRLINNGFIIRQSSFDKHGRRVVALSFSV
jgi:hypothetical protein